MTILTELVVSSSLHDTMPKNTDVKSSKTHYGEKLLKNYFSKGKIKKCMKTT